jgi:hypothetical protein
MFVREEVRQGASLSAKQAIVVTHFRLAPPASHSVSLPEYGPRFAREALPPVLALRI